MGNEELNRITIAFHASRNPHLAPASIRNFTITFHRFNLFLIRRGGAITTTTVLEFVDDLKRQDLLGSTIAGHMQRLRALFSWAMDYGYWVGISPVPRRLPIVSIKKKVEVITLEEHHKILALCDYENKPEWDIATSFGWAFGMRIGDAVARRWDEISFEKKQLTYTPAKTRRFGRALELPIPDWLMTKLVLKKCGVSGFARITPRLNDEYIYGSSDVSAAFTKLATRALKRRVGFHAYRHALVTRLISRGISLPLVGSITGHSPAMLLRYTHPTMDTKRAVLEEAS